jgi:hypothetical protein
VTRSNAGSFEPQGYRIVVPSQASRGQSSGSPNAAAEKTAIHLVSAWSVENQVVLAQVKVNDKSNEITAIPKLLDMLKLKGNMVIYLLNRVCFPRSQEAIKYFK